MKVTYKDTLPGANEVGLFWLGQAGFWIKTKNYKILIDPYLSDSLAKKYQGTVNDHKRIVEPPLSIEDLPRPDLILVTHAHTDHMDAETLAPIAKRHKDVPFLVPRAKLAEAGKRIGKEANLIGINSDETYELDALLKVRAFPAAHETLETDENGQNPHLGYGIDDDGFRIYHSGDSIPFDGLAERIRAFAPQVMLLPVNGRDERRLKSGIPGNFTLSEASQLAREADIFVPHHWGMFAFNTIDRSEIAAFIQNNTASNIVIPKHGNSIVLE